MDAYEVPRNLPEKPPKGLLEWARKTQEQELGGEYLIYRMERVEIQPSLSEILETESLKPKKIWAACCSCTACGEEFYTAGSASRILIAEGDDGCTYTVEPGTEQPIADCYATVLECADPDRVECPLCGAEARVIHSKRIKGGRTKRVKIASVESCGGYAAIIYWMVSREITEFGGSYYNIEPQDALVIGKRGGLTRFSRGQHHMYGAYTGGKYWRPMPYGGNDPEEICYQDWESIGNRKCGAVVYPVCGDLAGTTGEKTGVADFVKAGTECSPAAYIRAWKTAKGIENLVKDGWAGLIAEVVEAAWRYSYSIAKELDKVIDRTKSKPHEMLRLTKPEYRAFKKAVKKPGMAEMRAYQAFRKAWPTEDAAVFIEARGFFGAELTNAIGTGERLQKLMSYLRKEGCGRSGLRLLTDSRQMARELYGRELTSEEMWPRGLVTAHERLTAQFTATKNERKAMESLADFVAVKEKYGQLQWSDGELCMILPDSEMDLIREGEVLRHCVGGYGRKHISGSDTIFFVRHARRPERCYYTLDICMTDDHPYRVQLHGYGNERHGEHKQHSHKIPQKVKDFCARWEREILLPWAAERNRQKGKEKTA